MVSDAISHFCCFKIIQNRHRKHRLKAYAVELDLRLGCCRTWSESGPKVIEVTPRNICRKNLSQLPMSSGQIVGERGGTAFPFRFWRWNAVPLAYTTAVGGRGGTWRTHSIIS